MDILPHGGAGFTRTQNVLIHRTDVPRGAVGRGPPSSIVERCEQSDCSLEFIGLEAHRLVVGQWRDG